MQSSPKSDDTPFPSHIFKNLDILNLRHRMQDTHDKTETLPKPLQPSFKTNSTLKIQSRLDSIIKGAMTHFPLGNTTFWNLNIKLRNVLHYKSMMVIQKCIDHKNYHFSP